MASLYNGSRLSEIEEEVSTEELENRIIEAGGDGVFELGSKGEGSFDFERENTVYVAVWKESDEALTMDALVWTLTYSLVDPSTALIFLVHVFPETKYIPTPLGKLPINQVNPEQKSKFLAQERGKKRDFLHKFLSVCSAYQVKADNILIESDIEAKAILDLIPILNITKLVIGASKATIRRIRSKKGNGAAEQIVQDAPEFCEVKVICEGKEMLEAANAMTESPSPSPSPSPRATHSTPRFAQNEQQTTNDDSTACGCFKI